MPEGNFRYLSFLLRLWCVRQNEHETWRASLEDPRTGGRQGFATLEALIEYLFGITREQDVQQSKLEQSRK